MVNIQLHLLGELEVVRNGQVLDLPPSRKTRGLLAYLALNERSMRREQLCELLWEIPDDPRGSLRWSLSKLRKLVDDEQHQRIVADRSSVRFDGCDLEIDVQSLHQLAENGLDQTATDDLEQAVERYRGGFLEGLDLPDFHDFYTWCIGQREHATRSQARLYQTLLERLAENPAKCLPHATHLVTLLPYDEEARASLVTLLLQLDRKAEAEQQYRMGLEKLREAGGSDTGLLSRAWRAKTAPPVSGVLHDAERVSAPEAIGITADTTLVGREAELSVIAEMLSGIRQENAKRVMLIRGDPGMGKSSLLRATAAMARQAGLGILKASAFESELIRPFGVWNDALRRAVPDNPTSALLGSGERVTRDQVFASLSDLMSEETARRPLVVLFDDVQWCDESSAAALHYVLRMNRRQPFLVVAAARDKELRENPAIMQSARDLRHDKMLREIRLEPMLPEQLCELITRCAPGADAQRLSQECGGNPLLAQELARAELEGATGSSLAELVQDRMARLDEDAATVLAWAAVLAPRINLRSLEQVTGLPRDRIDAAFEAAGDQGILHPGERGLRFSHDLIARSIYQEISPARRQVMHTRVAELLEEASGKDLELAADLAHHAPKSGDPALACRAMVSAGKLCLRFYVNDDALALYNRGLEFASQLGDTERVCLTLELSDIRMNAAPLEDWEGAVAGYIDLAEQAVDLGALPHARLGYQMASYLRWLHGEWSGARRDSLQAERVTRSADDEAHILAMAEAAKCLAMLERDLSHADAMAMEASALARRSNINCPALPTSLGILRYHEGKLEAAVDHLEEARTLCKAQGDRVSEFLANEYLAVVEIERDDYAQALERCSILVDMGSKLREGSEHPFALALQTLCRYGVECSESTLDEVLHGVREADAKLRLIFLLNRAARLDIEQEQVEKALARTTEALRLAQLMERPSETAQAHINFINLSKLNNKIDPKPHVEAIEKMQAGILTGWARERAIATLENYG
jgi:DNA-binding SARP family transcriptional activator/tetratricopeptide (TPR) repeat protein